MSDQVGRRPVASGALVLLALGMILFAVAGNTDGLIVARVVQGFAVGAATGTTTAMIMDSAANPEFGSNIASAVPPLGNGVGAVLAGTLVEFAPLPRQLVFWVLTVVYVVLAALVWLVTERARPTDAHRESLWRSLRPSVGLPRSTRSVFFVLLPSIGATWALAGLYLSLGSSLVGSLLGVHSHFVVGLVLGAFFASGASGAGLSTVLPGRSRESISYLVLATGVAVTMVATLTSTLPVYVIGSIIAGFGFGAAFRFTVSALGAQASADQRGRVFATMYIASYFAFSVPALAAGLAAGQVGLKATATAYGVFELALIISAMVVTTIRARRGGETRARHGAADRPADGDGRHVHHEVGATVD